MRGFTSQRPLVEEALRRLGKARLVLAIHDVSYPSFADEEFGRGSPYTRGGHAFLSFASELGFNTVQFGPQGQMSRSNPSPYDGAAFSKSALALAPHALADPALGLLDDDERAVLTADPPAELTMAEHQRAFDVTRALAARVCTRLYREAESGVARARDHVAALERFREAAAAWLSHDTLYEILVERHGTHDWRQWPEVDRDLDARTDAKSRERKEELFRSHAATSACFVFVQYLLDLQHRELRARANSLGLSLFGDLQVGMSARDVWSREAFFLREYRMGAPPSRTNPDGQAWGYPVYDPRQVIARLGARPRPSGESIDGPLAFVGARLARLFADFDGVRIDHPHGLVCPWVYDAGDPDPDRAVGRGARLFESPERSDHPLLRTLAIARCDQVDPSAAPYADARVRGLTDEQVAEYATLMDTVVETAIAFGRAKVDVLCEVLSTCPEPLRLVMDRHGFGRFRVTQKADLGRPDDPYRSENALPRDWIMAGTHDTEPLARVVERWFADGHAGARATYLAERLEPDLARRGGFAETLARDPRALTTAVFADLLASRAANVSIFWADLFGERRIYNRPGIVHPENWRMRVPRDFGRVYAERVACGEACDLGSALGWALRARGPANDGLAEKLEERRGAQRFG